MSKHVRVRCPICGMLSWQSRLDEQWEFEVVIQHTKSKGRGHGFSNTYSIPEQEEGVWLLKLALIEKLRAVANELEGEARAELDAVVSDTIRAEGFAEGWKIRKISSAEARHSVSRVSGLTGRHVIFSIPGEEWLGTVVGVPSEQLPFKPFPVPSWTWERSPSEEGVLTQESVFTDDEATEAYADDGRTVEFPVSLGSFLSAGLGSQQQYHEPAETDSEEGGDVDEFERFTTETEEAP